MSLAQYFYIGRRLFKKVFIRGFKLLYGHIFVELNKIILNKIISRQNYHLMYKIREVVLLIGIKKIFKKKSLFDLKKKSIDYILSKTGNQIDSKTRIIQESD